jgi:Rieske Fe-S protein
MTDESQQHQCATRRCVLLGAGVLGMAGVLSACSTNAVPYDANDAGQAPGTVPSTSAASGNGMSNGMSSGMTDQASSSASAMGASAKAGGETGTLLGAASAVPVGGGMVYTAAKVVVTQPSKGEYKAFSAVCTHVGCVCNQVADGTINCPCHGSKFKITDGSVVAGPAPSPLAAKTVNVSSTGQIYLQ